MPMSISRPVRVALDAMGGDYAPAHEVEGAVLAIRDAGPLLDLTLVGDEPKLRQEMGRVGAPDTLKVVQASQVITMEDPPTAALKLKRDSSLAVGMRYHQEGRVDAFVSAGNTGAVLSASTLILGRVKGVSRPTIGTFIPAERGVCLLVDAGTNVDCRAQQLYEFGVMGSIYFQKVMGTPRPTVALLNVGEERYKGTDVVLEAYKLLESGPVNFIGNVEGRDILKAKADVVVCDGFVGNIVLKFGESVPSFLRSLLRSAADKSTVDKLSLGLARGAMRRALRVLDPNEHGGVPVLGVNGVSIIGHGSSTAVGIKNMILRAMEVANSGLNSHIASALSTPVHVPAS
ncbi:MAG: hypothetical protein A3G43_02745 [Ignavibacteria bacterium RIFCSPLOWO2_12_FULL_56_21]|nr:MAG: hypothetical protein A3G43_02745 [Ignavibacteria bacterium RIFCSPLOWO2_12_FULL_56_21]